MLVNLAISDDFTKEIALETYGEDRTASREVGRSGRAATGHRPETGLVAEQIEAGMTLGTRIALAVDAEEEFGDGRQPRPARHRQQGRRSSWSADLEAVAARRPGRQGEAAPAWAPKVVSTDGEPTAIDSPGWPSRTSRQGGPHRRPDRGRRAGGREGRLAIVNYLGQTWGGEKPFDGSYTKKRSRCRSTSPVGAGPGRRRGLDRRARRRHGGQPGRSSQIPPAKGYGKAGPRRDHQGGRHPLLRDRRPRRGLMLVVSKAR